MIEIKTKLRKWGNSLGIVVPLSSLYEKNLKEGDDVNVIISVQNDDDILRKSFGTIKLKKSVDKFMRELDKELYND
ncbi:hypothetical protein J4218_06265 [Candidatus Pacearchaeota archaeon]|nr:hypothetical protein [Candidatus Pacearchaeota archaeon]